MSSSKVPKLSDLDKVRFDLKKKRVSLELLKNRNHAMRNELIKLKMANNTSNTIFKEKETSFVYNCRVQKELKEKLENIFQQQLQATLASASIIRSIEQCEEKRTENQEQFFEGLSRVVDNEEFKAVERDINNMGSRIKRNNEIISEMFNFCEESL